MTQPKPKKSLRDVAEAWDIAGHFDVSNDHAPDYRAPADVDTHDGRDPGANNGQRALDISTGRKGN